MKNLFVLELNEINFEILQTLVGQGKLPNFQRLMKTHDVVKTRAGEDYHKLEPWIQWVTVHTGMSQSQHKAFNLTDGQHLHVNQVWDVLEANGFACGVVSPMNGRRGRISKGFYIPDPWSATDDAYPDSLKPIYKFLSERVNSHNSSLDRGSSKMRFFVESVRTGVSLPATLRLAMLYIRAKIDKRTKWKLAAEFDRYLVELTLALCKRFKPNYVSIFLNGVAHYQHHYWSRHNRQYWASNYPRLFNKRNPLEDQNLKDKDDPISYGMQAYDHILGRVQTQCPDSQIVILTGLGQVPFEGYEGHRGFYLYRAYDHATLLKALGVEFQRTVPLMSRDLMIYFADRQAVDVAGKILDGVRVNGEKLFAWTRESDNRLFVKIAFTFASDDSTLITIAGSTKTLKFRDWFQFITFKTGHHSPEGIFITPKGTIKHLQINDGFLPLETVCEFLKNSLSASTAPAQPGKLAEAV
jgi:hypothetical protein